MAPVLVYIHQYSIAIIDRSLLPTIYLMLCLEGSWSLTFTSLRSRDAADQSIIPVPFIAVILQSFCPNCRCSVVL